MLRCALSESLLLLVVGGRDRELEARFCAVQFLFWLAL